MQQDNHIQYKILSELFKYPSAQLTGKVSRCLEILRDRYPDTLNTFEKFANWVMSTPLYEMEEVFTKTFHIQAICYLDLGFVLFGEDYKRGEFLVNMKREQQNANNECGEELPDNLVNVLTLMPKIKDGSFRNELAVRIVIPALQKMLEEFQAARMELKNRILKKKHRALLQEDQRNGNVYQYAIKTLLKVFEADFHEIHFEERQSAFSPVAKGFETAVCGGCSFINNKSIKTVKT